MHISQNNRFKVIFSAVIIVIAVVLSVHVLRNTPADPTNPMSPENGDSTVSYTGESATRAQWITMLVEARGYSRFTDIEPFFPDVQAGHPAYTYIQLAAIYNLIDTEADLFYPDEKATRAFVAVTTAKAVGFFGEPEAVLNDISSLPDAEIICLSVDNGIFSIPSGNFNPNGEVTIMECDDIIAKIKSLTTIDIDPNRSSYLNIHDNILDLTHTAAAISYHGTGSMYMNISGSDAELLTEGMVYILPPTSEYPYGVARKVVSIDPAADGSYAVINEEPTLGEVLSGFDVHGEFYPDFNNISWSEGVTGRVVNMDDITPVSAGVFGGIAPMPTVATNLNTNPMLLTLSTPQTRDGVKLEFDVKVGDNKVKGTLAVAAKATLDMKEEYISLLPPKMNQGALIVDTSVYAELEAELSLRGSVITLCRIPIPVGTTGAAVMLRVFLDVSGEVKISYQESVSFEYGVFVTNNKPSLHHKLNEQSHNVDASAQAEILAGFKPGLTFFGIGILDIEASIGFGVYLGHRSSAICTDLSVYMPLTVGVDIFPQIKYVLDFKYKIWTENNSPVRATQHMEAGVRVDPCTKPIIRPDDAFFLSGEMFTADILGFDIELPIEYQNRIIFIPTGEDSITLALEMDDSSDIGLFHFYLQSREEYDENAKEYYRYINSGLPMAALETGLDFLLPYSSSYRIPTGSWVIALNSESVLRIWTGTDTAHNLLDMPDGQEVFKLYQVLGGSLDTLHYENVPNGQPTFDLYLKSTWQNYGLFYHYFSDDEIILTGTIKKESWHHPTFGWLDSAILVLDTPIEQIVLPGMGIDGEDELFENVKEVDVTFRDAFDYFSPNDNVVIVCEPFTRHTIYHSRPIVASVKGVYLPD